MELINPTSYAFFEYHGSRYIEVRVVTDMYPPIYNMVTRAVSASGAALRHIM